MMYQQRQYNELLNVIRPRWEEDKTNGEALYWLICCLYEKDEKEDAIKYGIQGILKVTNKTWKGRLFLRIGSFYWRIGDFKNAESHYRRSFDLLSEFGNDTDVARVKNNLGILYDLRGELDQALILYEEALALNTKANNERQISSNLVNIGIILLTQHKTVEAINIFNKALNIFQNNELKTGIVVVSHRLMQAYIRLGKITLANEMFNQIESIAAERDSSLIQGIYLLSKAIKFKISNRLKDRVYAMEIFNEIINNSNFEYEQIINAMIHLTSLKLDEFKLLGNHKILNEIKELITQIHDFAEKNQTYPLIVETKLLQIRLLVINDEFDKAHKMLSSTREFIKINDLDHLNEKINKEEINFEKTITPIESLISKNQESITKMEYDSIQDYLATLKSVLD